MKRRDAIKTSLLLAGGMFSLTGILTMGSSCSAGSQEDSEGWLSADQRALLDEIVETLIPATDTPGAKQAGVGEFVAYMVHDCQPEEDHKMFKEGLSAVEETANKAFGNRFVALQGQQREEVLRSMQSEHPEFYRLTSQLTSLGYFTSKPGATQALDFVFTPGKYDPCLKIDQDKKTWAM